MANRTPFPSSDSYNSGNPFAERPHTVGFQEPSPFASSTTLSRDNQLEEIDAEEEKQPLTQFPGGLYPPGYAIVNLGCFSCFLTPFFLSPNSPVDPVEFGDPYGRPVSTVSTATSGVDSAWRRRQTIKRGVTRRVKLTNGNFIAEYKVPTPVYSAIETKFSNTNTTEFSYVTVFDITLPSYIYR